MANRTAADRVRSLGGEPHRLYCKFAVVDGGTCTLSAAPYNLGITSVVESGTGVFTITLQDKWYELAGVQAIADDTGGSDKVYFEIDASATDVNAATPVVVLTAMANNTAKNMTAANLVYVTIDLFNRSV